MTAAIAWGRKRRVIAARGPDIGDDPQPTAVEMVSLEIRGVGTKLMRANRSEAPQPVWYGR
jgi:hypothetical protein